LVLVAVGCRHHVDATSGAATPEGAVRGVLEAANRGEDPSAFLLDGPRCRALYASKDAPQISERGRAADEASCAQGAAILRDELKRLPKGHLVISVGVAKSDPYVGTSVPVTLHVDTDAFAPTDHWYAMRVNGRYYAAKKVIAPVENRGGTADILPAPGDPPKKMTVAELRRALASPDGALKTGDFIVVDGEYMGTDHGDGRERVGIVEDASAQNVEFTVTCLDPGLSPDVEPGKKVTAAGILRRDALDGATSATLDTCSIK
jgi:hypothetical protein